MKRHEFKEVTISNFFQKINNPNNLIFENMCGEIQRKIDIDHLNELIQYQKSYYEKYNEFLFPNPIILCKLADKFAVIDGPVSYTHLRAHETSLHLVCRLLREKIFMSI